MALKYFFLLCKINERDVGTPVPLSLYSLLIGTLKSWMPLTPGPHAAFGAGKFHSLLHCSQRTWCNLDLLSKVFWLWVHTNWWNWEIKISTCRSLFAWQFSGVSADLKPRVLMMGLKFVNFNSRPDDSSWWSTFPFEVVKLMSAALCWLWNLGGGLNQEFKTNMSLVFCVTIIQQSPSYIWRGISQAEFQHAALVKDFDLLHPCAKGIQ